MDEKYLKIIDKPYQKSKIRKQMSLSERAGQFMPFSALTGYDDVIEQHNKAYQDKKILSSDEIENINNMLIEILNSEKQDVLIRISYYDNQIQKEKVVVDRVKKIDVDQKRLTLADGKIIEFNDIYNIQWYN